jgi:hypothetical protein
MPKNKELPERIRLKLAEANSSDANTLSFRGIKLEGWVIEKICTTLSRQQPLLNIKTLDFTSASLSSSKFQNISRQLLETSAFPNLTKLYFNNNRLNNDGGAYLCKALTKGCLANLEELHIEDNWIKSAIADQFRLAITKGSMPKLTKIEFGSQGLVSQKILNEIDDAVNRTQEILGLQALPRAIFVGEEKAAQSKTLAANASRDDVANLSDSDESDRALSSRDESEDEIADVDSGWSGANIFEVFNNMEESSDLEDDSLSDLMGFESMRLF